MDDVQRKPAADEYGDHGYEHPVRLPLSADLQVFALPALRADLDAGAHAQRLGDPDVAEGDDAARNDVLEDEAGDGEKLARRQLRPLLVTYEDALRF